MNVEEELNRIKFSELSRVFNDLLNKILLERINRRDSDKELDLEELDSVAAAEKDNKIREEYLNEQ
ncbi:MAG: hypothetical protein IJQ85_00835 [Selenomonadaceae bacterium]|nr:hypothetical protein [Selenomonadaceae bacterium]